MPLSRLPSLSSLRAFEAAARRLSFKDAADELSVTPGAISQQIRALEEDLGTPLFHRATRSVALTKAGLTLQPHVTEGFLKIRGAVDKVRPVEAKTISVSAAGSVIRNWLLPRLHHFTERHPNLQTQVKTLYGWEDFELAEDEVALRLATEPPPGLFCRKIHQVLLMPMASPDFLDQHDVKTQEDVLRLPLMQDAILQQFEQTPGWEKWFKAAGIDAPVPDYALTFDNLSAEYAIDMAISGRGMLLGWSILTYHAMSQGKLVCPFGPVVEVDLSYYLLCHPAQANAPHVKAFMDWIDQEAAMVSTMRAFQMECLAPLAAATSPKAEQPRII